MSNLGSGILSGVIGAIVTAVILFVAMRMWKGTIEPWFENLVYKGVRLDGVWRTEMEIKGTPKGEVVVLNQSAHRVTGTVTYAEDTKGMSHTYRLSGWFFDNVLTAITEEVGPGRSDRGAVVLAFRPGRASPLMEGIGVWFDGVNAVTSEYKWTRERD